MLSLNPDNGQDNWEEVFYALIEQDCFSATWKSTLVEDTVL